MVFLRMSEGITFLPGTFFWGVAQRLPVGVGTGGGVDERWGPGACPGWGWELGLGIMAWLGLPRPRDRHQAPTPRPTSPCPYASYEPLRGASGVGLAFLIMHLF